MVGAQRLSRILSGPMHSAPSPNGTTLVNPSQGGLGGLSSDDVRTALYEAGGAIGLPASVNAHLLLQVHVLSSVCFALLF